MHLVGQRSCPVVGAGVKLPSPSNMHGEKGSPPTQTKPGEFNIIVPLRPDDLPDMFADTTAARRLLGYEPAVALEDGLSRTIAWHRTARVGLSR